MDILLGLLTLPLYVLVPWPLVVASRRVLGVRIGTLRALRAAGFGWLVATGIGQAFRFPCCATARPRSAC